MYNYFKNVVEEIISQELKVKNIDERRNYFLEEIEQNELMSRKHKRVCTILNYIEHFLTLASTITGCILISTFASLLGIPVGITSSPIGLKVCAFTTFESKFPDHTKYISTPEFNKRTAENVTARSKQAKLEVILRIS